MRLGAGTLGGELGGDDLVHDGDVGLDAEDLVVEIDGAGVGAGSVAERDGGHQAAPPLAAEWPFTASRMTTRPPLGPGTAPRTSTTCCSASERTTFRFSVVTLVATHAAGHAHALEHAGRRGALADGAGRAVHSVGAVRRRLAGEVVALHDTGEALALDSPR